MNNRYRLTAAGEVEEVPPSEIENSGITIVCPSLEQAKELFAQLYAAVEGKNLLDILMEIPFED